LPGALRRWLRPGRRASPQRLEAGKLMVEPRSRARAMVNGEPIQADGARNYRVPRPTDAHPHQGRVVRRTEPGRHI